jgi:hypothetical protein
MGYDDVGQSRMWTVETRLPQEADRGMCVIANISHYLRRWISQIVPTPRRGFVESSSFMKRLSF